MTERSQHEGSNLERPLWGYAILVVDDEPDIRTYLAALFEDLGARVYEAADGDQCCEVAKREQPDLITLDLSMPGTDGIGAFRTLRTTPETADIAVCVITGHPEFRKLIYERPVRPPEGFMGKPIDEKRLVSNVRRILEIRRRKRARGG